MRCTWPFNGRGAKGQHQNGNGYGASAARPDFLCVGAQKGGTTWLYWQLDSHPDFWMPPVKELHYFDKPKRTNRVRPPRRPDKRDVCFLESLKSLGGRHLLISKTMGVCSSQKVRSSQVILRQPTQPWTARLFGKSLA